MTYLLDVNVLIALLDEDHVFHGRAEDWYEAEASRSWATCPHTQNGVLRILGSARYPKGPGTPAAVAALLADVVARPGHNFWADDVNPIASPLINVSRMGSSAQVTDTYLLALAVAHNGMLATFDRRLTAAAVRGGGSALHLIA